MKFCLYAHEISPHLMPLAREMVKMFGAEEVRYVYTNSLGDGRKKMGWVETQESWVINKNEQPDAAGDWLLNSEILLCEHRDLDLWKNRAENGKGIFYTSERWFKPILTHLPGWLRLLKPSYLKMAMRAGRLFNKYDNLVYLVDGVHAAKDFVRVSLMAEGNMWGALFPPELNFDKCPGSYVGNRSRVRVQVLSKRQLLMWGYFVTTSEKDRETVRREHNSGDALKILWVGRFLGWKRVDTIIRAAAGIENVSVDLFGVGPEEKRLRKLASRLNAPVSFHKPVPISEVRKVMREHDMYILSSNAWEGWGAVVNEALEEGMDVVGTYEAGASSAMLPDENLFHCGDWLKLKDLITTIRGRVGIGPWSVANAARVLVGLKR